MSSINTMDLAEILKYGVINYVNPDKVVKRKIQPVDMSTLRGDQPKAYEDLILWANGGIENCRLACLTGYAGTGKSYLTNFFIESFLHSNPNRTILVTAPTNNAVKHIRNTAAYTHSTIDYRTIHSALGLKQSYDNNGKIKFVPDKLKPPDINNKTLLVLDEVSMLNLELFMNLMEYTTTLKILFVGDEGQIPPIGEEDAIPLDPEKRKEYGIHHINLDTVVRQASGNSIISLATEIRSNFYRVSRPDIFTDVTDFKGILSYEDFGKTPNLDKVLIDIYTSDAFAANSKMIKWGAHKNVNVNNINKKIRGLIYGQDVPFLITNEVMLANSVVFDPVESKDIIMSTNDEFVIDTLSYDEIKFGKFNKLKFYNVDITVNDDGIDRKHKNLRILHEDSYEDYDLILSQLAAIAKEHPKGSYKALEAWGDFHSFKNNFADVRHNYAHTAHKLQGLTVDTMIVLTNDVMRNFKVRERNRIMYTLSTRPSRLLIC